jgi:hypothetical protein
MNIESQKCGYCSKSAQYWASCTPGTGCEPCIPNGYDLSRLDNLASAWFGGAPLWDGGRDRLAAQAGVRARPFDWIGSAAPKRGAADAAQPGPEAEDAQDHHRPGGRLRNRRQRRSRRAGAAETGTLIDQRSLGNRRGRRQEGSCRSRRTEQGVQRDRRRPGDDLVGQGRDQGHGFAGDLAVNKRLVAARDRRWPRAPRRQRMVPCRGPSMLAAVRRPRAQARRGLSGCRRRRPGRGADTDHSDGRALHQSRMRLGADRQRAGGRQDSDATCNLGQRDTPQLW